MNTPADRLWLSRPASGTVSHRVIVAARTRTVRAAPNAHWRKSSSWRMYSAALKLEDEGTPS